MWTGRSRWSARTKQRLDLVHDLIDHRRWGPARKIRLACPPIQAFDLICKDYAGHGTTGRKRHLERVALHPRCDRTEEGQSGLPVVEAGTQRQRRTASGLLMSRLGGEREPDDVATVGSMRGRYHASSPTAGPVSTSECSVSGVIRATISARSWVFLRITSRSPRGCISMREPSRTPHCSATGLGMRTARLLPHRAICELAPTVSPRRQGSTIDISSRAWPVNPELDATRTRDDRRA